MTCARIISVFMALLGLIACDDNAEPTTRTAQQAPDLAQIHAIRGIEQLQTQLLVNPNNFAALSRLGDLYFESGQYQLAIQSYDKALVVNSECAGCLNDKGLAQFYIGDTEGALASFDMATVIDPDYPNAWLSKGYVLFSVGKYQEAIAPLRQVGAVDSSGTLTAEADKFLALIAVNVEQE